MTIRQVLHQGAACLKENPEIESPLLDSSLLIALVLDCSREKLLASLPESFPAAKKTQFDSLIKRRLNNEPFAYLQGKKEFFGHEFMVESGVLVPRPETELIVEKVIEIVNQNIKINSMLDLCCGSGNIAISCKLALPHLKVSAADISPVAERVLQRNAINLLGKKIPFFRSSYFDDLDGRYDIICTNPPYLTREEMLQKRRLGWKEPELALDGGLDGMEGIREIIGQAVDFLSENAYLIIEMAPRQVQEAAGLLLGSGFKTCEILPDLAGRERVVLAYYEKS